MSLPIGARIGILGGGQLGRMLASAGARLGFDIAIFCPEADTPAARVAASHWQYGYDDTAAVQRFAAECDAVTLEWENVPVSAAETIAATGTPIRPGVLALQTAQDRVAEKTFLEASGISCAPWRAVSSVEELTSALGEIGPDAILKTRRDGYDGKGQARLGAGSDAAAEFAKIGGKPAILEGFVPFSLEISAIVARGADGAVARFPPSRNEHEAGILRRSTVPCGLAPDVIARAHAHAAQLAEALDYVGVLALEFFVMANGTLLGNEFAPRVHNSGHWTFEACATCQFENHIRAVAGWPLGPTELICAAEMDNLIGEDIASTPARLAAGESVTLYGKHAVHAGRKMGHAVRRIQS